MAKATCMLAWGPDVHLRVVSTTVARVVERQPGWLGYKIKREARAPVNRLTITTINWVKGSYPFAGEFWELHSVA
jgi:hypothetical protein